MIHGPLATKILRFAIPLALTGILQQLFNAADVAIVGRYVGKTAMAAVGANTSVVGLIVGLFVGISVGANVVIAMAIGRGSEKTIREAVHTAIVFAVIASLCIMGVGEVFAGALMRLLSVPESVLPMAELYLRVYLTGMPAILLYNFIAAIFRSKGDTRTPLIALTAAGVLNVLLNLLFVIRFHMAAEGVALATVLSNVISTAILLVRLHREQGPLQFRFHELKIRTGILKEILRIGLPAGIQSSIFSLANMIIQSAINSLGETVMAGSSAAFNIEIVSFFVLNAFGQSCTTFVGQNYGAGEPERCRRAFILCLIEGGIATLACVIALFFYGRELLAIFNREPAVIEAGFTRMTFLLMTHPFSMLNDTFSGYMRGFGRSALPAVISLIGICGVRIFWVFFVFPQHATFAWLMRVYPISMILTATAILISILITRPARALRVTF